MLHRVIRPNLQTCDKEGPVYRYSERPLDTHKTRFSLIRRQYRPSRSRPLIILKLNRIIDWEPRALTRVEGELAEKIEEFHTGNVYFTCKGYESVDLRARARNSGRGNSEVKPRMIEDPNFSKVKFINPQNHHTGKTWKGQSWANGCDKAGDDVGCIPISWFEKYSGNDPFAWMREQVTGRMYDTNSYGQGAYGDDIVALDDPCDSLINQDESNQCELQQAERLDKGYKENLMSKGIIPKIVKKSCWPFMIALVEAKDISKPVKVQCKAWLANINVGKDVVAEDVMNNVEVTFGFQDLSNCRKGKDGEDCDSGGWFEDE